jgi:hypothetical protein
VVRAVALCCRDVPRSQSDWHCVSSDTLDRARAGEEEEGGGDEAGLKDVTSEEMAWEVYAADVPEIDEGKETCNPSGRVYACRKSMLMPRSLVFYA